MAENNRKHNISGEFINDNVPNEEQAVRGNGAEVRAQVPRDNGDVEANIFDRGDEDVETQLLRFTQQYPIARRMLRPLTLVALVNLCVAYQSIFDFLSSDNPRIRELCDCFDLVTVFGNIPRTPRIINLLERFRPNNIILRHRNESSMFNGDILCALGPLNLHQLFITVLNRDQELDVHPIQTKKLVLIFHPLHAFLTLMNSILQSLSRNVEILIIENGSLNDMSAIIFRNFS